MDEDEQAEVRERRAERTEHVESILEATETLLDDERKYPTRTEELAEAYADQEIDLPNETESLGSVFDRLTAERFEDPMEAREAVLNELTGEEGGPEEYNDERPIEPLAEDASAAEAIEDQDEAGRESEE